MLGIWPVLRRLIGLAGVLALLWVALALDLAPFAGAALSWPAPDLLVCIVACLVLRRPAVMPGLLVFAAGLVRDFLSGGAVGPGALSLLLACEMLRGRAAVLHRRGFLLEWAEVAAVAALPVLLPAALQWIAFEEVPGQGRLAVRWLATALCYPAVVALLRVGHDRSLRGADRRAGSLA